MSLKLISSIFLKFAATTYSSYREKTAKIEKFTKLFKILTKGGLSRTLLKLVVPPNLLKQENICLIPLTYGSLQGRGQNTLV